MSDAVKAVAPESELVWQFFERKRAGVFVEVGANHPVNGSQTWFLEQQGWSGVLVEPQAALAAELRPARPAAKVFQAACSAPGHAGEANLILAEADGVATLSPQRDSHGATYVGVERVRLATLDEILVEAGIDRIDFLSLDVEGHELEVMRGLNFKKYRPALVVIEDGVRDLQKHRFLIAKGYRLVKRTTLNNWYIPRERPFHLTSPRERLELIRKMYLALPFRKIRLWLRRRANAKGAAA